MWETAVPTHVPVGFPSRGARRCPEPELPRWDAAAVGTARAPRLRAVGRGGCARGKEGRPRRRGTARSCPISTAGSRRCCFHF